MQFARQQGTLAGQTNATQVPLATTNGLGRSVGGLQLNNPATITMQRSTGVPQSTTGLAFPGQQQGQQQAQSFQQQAINMQQGINRPLVQQQQQGQQLAQQQQQQIRLGLGLGGGGGITGTSLLQPSSQQQQGQDILAFIGAGRKQATPTHSQQQGMQTASAFSTQFGGLNLNNPSNTNTNPGGGLGTGSSGFLSLSVGQQGQGQGQMGGLGGLGGGIQLSQDSEASSLSAPGGGSSLLDPSGGSGAGSGGLINPGSNLGGILNDAANFPSLGRYHSHLSRLHSNFSLTLSSFSLSLSFPLKHRFWWAISKDRPGNLLSAAAAATVRRGWSH